MSSEQVYSSIPDLRPVSWFAIVLVSGPCKRPDIQGKVSSAAPPEQHGREGAQNALKASPKAGDKARKALWVRERSSFWGLQTSASLLRVEDECLLSWSGWQSFLLLLEIEACMQSPHCSQGLKSKRQSEEKSTWGEKGACHLLSDWQGARVFESGDSQSVHQKKHWSCLGPRNRAVVPHVTWTRLEQEVYACKSPSWLHWLRVPFLQQWADALFCVFGEPRKYNRTRLRQKLGWCLKLAARRVSESRVLTVKTFPWYKNCFAGKFPAGS